MNIERLEKIQKFAQEAADDDSLYENESFAAIANALYEEIKAVKPESTIIKSVEYPEEPDKLYHDFAEGFDPEAEEFWEQCKYVGDRLKIVVLQEKLVDQTPFLVIEQHGLTVYFFNYDSRDTDTLKADIYSRLGITA